MKSSSYSTLLVKFYASERRLGMLYYFKIDISEIVRRYYSRECYEIWRVEK